MPPGPQRGLRPRGDREPRRAPARPAPPPAQPRRTPRPSRLWHGSAGPAPAGDPRRSPIRRTGPGLPAGSPTSTPDVHRTARTAPVASRRGIQTTWYGRSALRSVGVLGYAVGAGTATHRTWARAASLTPSTP